MSINARITRFLDRAPQPVFVIYATVVSFGAYFCMYAFRKPFSAAKFEGEGFGWFSSDMELKSAIIISQILGYALSKYIGIKVCSEIVKTYRASLMVGLILVAEIALFFFAIIPGEWKVVAIFFNGLPLGMIWGLVVWYLEGRRTSEILLAGLSCSFIMSSGIVKDFGVDLMNGEIAERWQAVPVIGTGIGNMMGQVSESWMPFVEGLHFLPLFILFVWGLTLIPQPTDRDIVERSERVTMDGSKRWAFVKQFAFGLAMLFVTYLVLTAYRDFRDNFLVNILEDLNVDYVGKNKSVISGSETTVAFIVMAVMAGLNAVRENKKGLFSAFIVMGVGCILLPFASISISNQMVTPYVYILLTGLGSYLIYVPFNSMLFDRIIAFTRFSGTAVFAIYLADSIGYTGSVVLLFIKDKIFRSISYFDFFNAFTSIIGFIAFIFLGLSMVYFFGKKAPKNSEKISS